MSANVNKWIGIGRLGRDPEIRFTASGQAVANFSIAVDETYKDRAGERQKKTEWVNLVCWGKSVENFISKYLHKGDLVYVEGKLQTRQWEDKSGATRYTTEINVQDIQILSSIDQTAKPEQRAKAAPNDDDIPF
jgi:single-strand DNA-binding protein